MWASFVQNTPCQYQPVIYLVEIGYFKLLLLMYGKISVIIHHQPIIGGYTPICHDYNGQNCVVEGKSEKIFCSFRLFLKNNEN